MDKKAVVCDDDRTMGVILKRILSKAGFAVSTAENGDDGLALVASQKPSLLVLDLDMPVKDGWTVLRELRGKTEGLFIVVLSAHESPDKHDMARSLGAGDVLVKPFNPADFLGKIEALVKAGKL